MKKTDKNGEYAVEIKTKKKFLTKERKTRLKNALIDTAKMAVNGLVWGAGICAGGMAVGQIVNKFGNKSK